jgi:hypothetical protein
MLRAQSLRPSPLRLAFFLLLTAAMLPGRSAFADDYGMTPGTKGVAKACQPELTRYCARSSAGLHQMSGCLRSYYINLSLICRNALKRASPQATDAPAGSETGLTP